MAGDDGGKEGRKDYTLPIMPSKLWRALAYSGSGFTLSGAGAARLAGASPARPWAARREGRSPFELNTSPSPLRGDKPPAPDHTAPCRLYAELWGDKGSEFCEGGEYGGWTWE